MLDLFEYYRIDVIINASLCTNHFDELSDNLSHFYEITYKFHTNYQCGMMEHIVKDCEVYCEAHFNFRTIKHVSDYNLST